MNQYGTNFRAPTVNVHEFAMIPRAEIPRSSFRVQFQHKTTMSAAKLIPVYLEEVLPGDSFNVNMTAFIRLATPIFPIMDNIKLESFFFFVPNRLVWNHWTNFMGEQNNPSDSISYSIPTITSPAGGFDELSLYDYFGLPVENQTAAGETITVSALPFRAYNLIYQEWFRDENLQDAVGTGSGGALGPGDKFMCVSDDGPDDPSTYVILTPNKIHDYFTSCLPWTEKGGVPVSIPLGGHAPVNMQNTPTISTPGAPLLLYDFSTQAAPTSNHTLNVAVGTGQVPMGSGVAGLGDVVYPANLYADLSAATAATINSIRLAFQTQKLLERDARGGTRYTEIIRSHFGVTSPDMRLMRPEYLGGSKTPLNVVPVPQTTATGLTGGTSPLGTLSAVGTGMMHGGQHGFRYSATEHGYIIGLVCARRDQVYQQGIRRLWMRQTRYDFYMPVFAMLGEQSVFNYEIYSDGTDNDALTFGYQERWAEYRYHPSYTSGYFRSTNADPLDAWHLAIKFNTLPVLNGSFVEDETDFTLNRVLAAGSDSNHQQLLCDFFFDQKVARPMPVYSVPGLIDHF